MSRYTIEPRVDACIVVGNTTRANVNDDCSVVTFSFFIFLNGFILHSTKLINDTHTSLGLSVSFYSI